MRINLKEYADVIPNEPGTVQINHRNCPAGVDTKRRLGITRKDDGTILAHCFHCGDRAKQVRRGVRHKDQLLSNDTKAKDKVVTSTYLNSVLEKCDDYTKSRAAKLWVDQYALSPHILDMEYSLYYNPKSYRAVVPCWDVNNKLTGLQERRLSAGNTPKYLTTKCTDEPLYAYHKGVSADSKTLVLCEDVLSMLKLSEFFPAAALLGTNLPVSLVRAMPTMGIDKVVLWLDNDNPTVLQQRAEIAHLLSTGITSPGLPVFIIDNVDDPKNNSKEYIYRKVLEVTNGN